MKKMTRLVLALLAVLLCFALTACQQAPAETPETVATQAPAAEAAQATEVPAGNPDDVLVTINGANITRADYDSYLKVLVNYYTNAGYDISDPTMYQVLQQFALQTGMEYAVMDQKVVELGLGLTEEEKTAAQNGAKQEWEAVIADGMAYYGITDESTEEERAATLVSILAELETQGYTEESYISDAVTYAGYDKLAAELTKDVTVTDEEVVNYYNSLVEADKVAYENDAAAYESVQQMNQIALMYGMSDYYTEVYYMPNGYRAVTHILLNVDEALLTAYSDLQAKYEEQQNTLEEGGEVTDTLVTAEEVENARLAVIASVQPTIDEIKQKIADGAAFNDLIPTYSQDTGMTTAEAIAEGYAVHMDSTMWDPVFTAAAFSVDTIGQVSEPVVGMYGVHLVHYDHDVAGGPVELTEELKASFKAALLASAQDEVYYATIEEWVNASEIVYSDEAKVIMGVTDEAAAETPAE